MYPVFQELLSIAEHSKAAPAIDDTMFTAPSDTTAWWFWTGTTHGDNTKSACYVCFGICDAKDGLDTHGAGAQRADPKTGDPADYLNYGGDQDDRVQIYNYVRCVRGGIAVENTVTTDPDSVGYAPGRNN